MHIEFLVEDLSTKALIESLLPKLLPTEDYSYRIVDYRGIGHLPPGLRTTQDPRKRVLLHQLPRLLQGYGKTPGIDAVVVVVDSDTRPCANFLAELQQVLRSCNPAPRTLFRLAIEESEAWLLGDAAALLTAYPNAKRKPLETYQQDAICGTWETLAECVHPGGHDALSTQGYAAIGRAKSEWATNIGPHLDPNRNNSPSFRKFVEGLRRLIQAP
ncbi:MAG: DUF4276 family protein [Bryobacteraceae bacterium]